MTAALAYVRPSHLLRNLSLELRLALADFLIWASVVGWPLSALTIARAEPQFVLGLSWLAILFTGLDILLTTDVRNEQG
jgi:hypothetical protein